MLLTALTFAGLAFGAPAFAHAMTFAHAAASALAAAGTAGGPALLVALCPLHLRLKAVPLDNTLALQLTAIFGFIVGRRALAGAGTMSAALVIVIIAVVIILIALGFFVATHI